MKRQCVLLTNIILFLYCIGKTSSTSHSSRLLIISLDGFRHEYLKTYSFPTLNHIQKEGVKTKNGMQPTFATLTFPNHISIATGMYQEEHGIIHNRFYDKKLKKKITIGSKDEGQWSDTKVEPLWITATKQGIKSAVIYWPGGSNEFHGVRPEIYTPVYSDKVPIRPKMDDAISYFSHQSIQLVMLYHYEPDKQGHRYGPDANETHQALLRLDNDINYLLDKVKNELHGDLNIIILSDHGMANVKGLIQPFLEGYINRTAVYDSVLDGPLFSVSPRKGKFGEVLAGLRRIPGVTVYKRGDFPEKYHYAKAIDRIGDIIVIPNGEGILFSEKAEKEHIPKGNHGFDNTLLSMQAIFMAYGPKFNQHIEIDSLKNVDVYHIACKILDLVPNPFATAGSLNNLADIFSSSSIVPPNPVVPLNPLVPTNIENKCSRTLINMSVVLFFLFLNLIV